ncbi:MAG: hypothetical protein QOH56_853 [Pseudonocardiales bacterium]|jgi:hypothetical protein|nr:hypothetical protein [Pseudonocardiales bacterium]
MNSDLPLDDQPSGAGLIPVPDGAGAEMGEPFETPAATALLFLQALAEDVHEYRNALLRITTPESWDAWGDFTEAAEMVASLGGEWGIQSRGSLPEPGIAYIALMRDTPTALYVDGDVFINAAAIVSLVHRPALGGWRVHSYGADYWPPDDLPRDLA